MTALPEPPCSDAAVKTKTGRGWAAWCRLLDDEGATALAHGELAKLIDRKHAAGGWWSQTIAVGYERLRGQRPLYGRKDGTFAVNASRTLPVDAATAHGFFVDKRKRRRWLEEAAVVRTATAPKSVRLAWPDATRVAVEISASGKAKCVVAVEHSKLKRQADAARRKAFWKAALERLAAAVA